MFEEEWVLDFFFFFFAFLVTVETTLRLSTRGYGNFVGQLYLNSETTVS